MAGRGRPTYLKRQREAARQRRKMDKAEKRAQRKADKEGQESTAPPDVDPDIAGIVPGPQRQPWMEDGDYAGPAELLEEEEEEDHP